ncbi:MAG: class II fructose-bisphosphate aldolase [Clostridiales bacterium]|nr:class II fructose-bisphosphate aldolase [Clostridiales bacterium]
MPLVSSREMLKKAREGRYAVAAFNVENMEMVQAVLEAAKSLSSPVILATSAATLKYAPPTLFSAMVKAAADEAGIPVALHLDHGTSPELCQSCLEAGYSSIMIDASQLPYADNVRVSSQVVYLCKPYSVPVEAELGHVGGKEDDIATDGDLGTGPTQAADFVRQTGVDSLAVAIGTAHGFYKGVPVLDIKRLAEIFKTVSVPLVLHGASGLSDEAVRSCVKGGICKINYATELRAAYTQAARDILNANPDAIDPKLFGREAKKRVGEIAYNKMKVLGCEGKA